MPRKGEYRGISIKENFAKNVEDFIDQNSKFGYTSIAQFLEDSARRRLEELQSQIKEPARFEQVNCDEYGTKILDRQLREVVQIYIKPSGIQCGRDQTDNCEHIDFALKQPDVRDAIRKLKKEGWKLPDA
jgi:hypothetical protein